MELEIKLKLLYNKREYVFREIQILYDLSCIVTNDKSKLGSFKCRYKRINDLRQEFIDFTNEINSIKLMLNPSENIDMQTLDSFDTMYYAIMEVAEALLPSLSDESAAMPLAGAALNTTDYNNQKPISRARLPKIELIKFDGNIEHWQTFYDTFVSLVHTNNNISNIEKFHYLMSCLVGSALSIAKGIPITADNYQIVFDTLIDRYQNKRILAVNYLEKICNYSLLKTCNINDLRKLTSLLQESVNALKSIKIDNLGEFILFYLSSRKLDSDTRKRFELQNNKQIPTFNDLLIFLHGYIKVLEASEPTGSFLKYNMQSHLRKNNNNYNRSVSFPVRCEEFENTGPYSEKEILTNNYYKRKKNNLCSNIDVYAHATSNKYLECACCGNSNHSIYKCPVFYDKTVQERETVVKTKKICVNCLRLNHTADKCFSKTCCRKCNSRHHTLLHRDRDSTAACPAVSSVTPQGSADSESFVPINSVNSSANLEHGRSFVLLGTCVVQARGPNGVFNIRALIDSGAQDSFVTSACVQLLGLPLRRCNITVAGLGQNPIHEVKGMTSFTIQPQNSDQPKFNIQAIVMKSITHKMPSVQIPQIVKTNYRHLVLADNNFDKSGDIDLLIGAELFHSIYDGQRLDVGPGLPVALHSVFGWVITGRFDPEYQTPACTTALVASTLDLDNIVKQFWEVEEPPKARVTNPENKKCEQLYTDLVRRNEDGRYVVPILLREERKELGDSFHGSLSRLYNLEKRFRHHAVLKNEYCKFMKEYEDLNHMEVVKMSDKDSRYVIPHHCVLRPDSATTKLRVVFDASAKTTTGHSLNDIVYTGPKLLNDIVDIITKFRLHPLVFAADISKMYRNIDLRLEDRKYQHILWRNSSTEEVREYELKTVTYGVSSSPYLAIRTLHQLARDHGEQWPEAATILREDVFMDDIIAGAPNLACALDLKIQLINLLDCGKFELRKWTSNSPEFLAHLPTDHCQVPKAFCDDKNQQTLKILGVQWDPIEDNFTYSKPELRTLPHLVHTVESNHSNEDPIEKILKDYSSLSKVQRIVAWCLRFISKSRKLTKNIEGLTTEELESSLCVLVKHEQTNQFGEEIKSIKDNKSYSRSIQKLNPFIDQTGLLRVGGRLENAQLPLSAIYPLLLPKASRVSVLIIDYYHRLHLHCGPRTLQSIIQRKFWILGIRNLIRSRLAKCVTCCRVKPTPITPLMGNLPEPRVQGTRCFQNIGVDFAGPFAIKESKRRNARTYKVYICVMVCLAVKAIHLELVTDLSTQAFIAALDRFVSRRGLCKLIISDCGTNFVGAKRYLTEVQQFLLTTQPGLNVELSKRNIIWQHNPPTGSHFGGIFESGVKSMKYHLKRVVGLQVLTFEELLTVINKIEAVLNSRPLCTLSSDPSEVDVLTPGHFLAGGPLVSLPEMPLTEVYLPPRERWQMLQRLTQSFWRVWRNSYLHTLQQRCKWFEGQPNVKIDDVVVIVEQNLPPLEWRFGRVTALHPGTDGIVRVVTLRTANGLLRRPVVKVCPLPVNS